MFNLLKEYYGVIITIYLLISKGINGYKQELVQPVRLRTGSLFTEPKPDILSLIL